MLLSDVLHRLDLRSTAPFDPGLDVTGVAIDSRRVGVGDLFCCVSGAHADGHAFAPAALEAGAVALLVEHPVTAGVPAGVPQIVSSPGRIRRDCALGAAAVYGDPALRMDVVGVTGTNGKTTVVQMVRHVLTAAGRSAAAIGTLEGERTTPEAPDLQRALRDLADGGCEVVAMEVSSHGLVQHRVDGFAFRCAAFTNLSHDHLDFHGTMEAYFEAKAILFTAEHARSAVVCVDDEWGARMAERAAAAGLAVRTVRTADAGGIVESPGRTAFSWRGEEVALGLSGRANATNALVAAEICLELGVDAPTVVAALATMAPVPGRMELVHRSDPTLIVDFAHTPAALAEALATARAIARGHRVHVVFGCGGNRDAAKRGPMGEVASRLADVAIVTSDNARDEDPRAIADAVVAGATGPASVSVELDRRRAIEAAVSGAGPGDVVVIAGKGHEATQVTGAETAPFDDRVVAAEVLAALGARSGGSGT